jgi:phytoene synthase
VNWQEEGPRLQQRIIAALEKSLLPELSTYIEGAFYRTPHDFKYDYLSLHGAGFSIAPLFRQSAWFRFHNRDRHIKNLYLVGAGTHPGAGLPGVLCSAKLVDKLIANHLAENALATQGKSFYWARKMLAKKYAKRATRLYAFCRYVDDVADKRDSAQQAKYQLNEIKSQIIAGSTHHFMIQDMLDLMQECQIDTRVVCELLNGMLLDCDMVNIKDKHELLRYCYQVAGTVGVMMCHIFEVKHPMAYSHAISLGMAMQLTNICRDIQEDALKGRIYVPASLIGTHTPQALATPLAILQPKLLAAVKAILDLADEYYQRGEKGLSFLPLRARLCTLIASRVYHAIGNKLRNNNYIYWSGRMRVPQKSKVVITLRALLGYIISPTLWRQCKDDKN